MPTIDVVNNHLIFPLLGISKLHHAYNSSSTIKVIEDFALHLVSTINVLGCEVGVPIKDMPLEGSKKLFDLEVTLYTSIIASLDKMDVLLRSSLSIE